MNLPLYTILCACISNTLQAPGITWNFLASKLVCNVFWSLTMTSLHVRWQIARFNLNVMPGPWINILDFHTPAPTDSRAVYCRATSFCS
ncbi:hypothetical protein RSOLAG1IB_11853 [Rhizoctonia solani AG-1 IB]|uniref:Uncharacterized protein n=1 Tax=Thanatephorus cucumeris (strain AG1-IB / isolate 7/3/14) TaxID=1108050 RepID=A0A0B7FEY4_THACB|nr:hypothetical protein RSOLAG1IB_11853 [Rhizoctonia solani AG-1 IB]